MGNVEFTTTRAKKNVRGGHNTYYQHVYEVTKSEVKVNFLTKENNNFS